MQDVLRKYPDRAPSVIPSLHRVLKRLEDATGRAAVIWMVRGRGEKDDGTEDAALSAGGLLTCVIPLLIASAPACLPLPLSSAPFPCRWASTGSSSTTRPTRSSHSSTASRTSRPCLSAQSCSPRRCVPACRPLLLILRLPSTAGLPPPPPPPPQVKLFFKRPPEVQRMLGRLFKACLADGVNAAVHDRALLYFRLLRASVKVRGGERPPSLSLLNLSATRLNPPPPVLAGGRRRHCCRARARA